MPNRDLRKVNAEYTSQFAESLVKPDVIHTRHHELSAVGHSVEALAAARPHRSKIFAQLRCYSAATEQLRELGPNQQNRLNDPLRVLYLLGRVQRAPVLKEADCLAGHVDPSGIGVVAHRNVGVPPLRWTRGF